MAVYKTDYKRYKGPLTSERWRFAILSRYSFMAVFESKLLASFYVLCFIPALLAGGIIYANHNAKALEMLITGNGINVLPIDDAFFNLVFRAQTFLAFMLVTFIGPGLVSSDVANSALVIYLSKPFSRVEYVLGRLVVLLSLTSAMTWIAGLGLVALQTDLAGWEWLRQNYRIALALFVCFWVWIIMVSLLALAISATVKWKPLAAGSMLIVFFVGAGFGELVNQSLGLNRQWGLLLSMHTAISMMFDWLMTGLNERGDIPAWTALISLAALCSASLWLLYRKIRAYEVVR